MPCTGTGTTDCSQTNENILPPIAAAIPGSATPAIAAVISAAFFGIAHMPSVLLYPVTQVQLSMLVAPATTTAEFGGQLSGSVTEKGA